MNRKLFSSLLAAGLLTVATAAHAQRRDQVVAAPATLAQEQLAASATDLTRSMSARLRLNEAQYIRLQLVNKTRVEQVALLGRMYGNDPGALATKMTELDAQYERECSRVLTPSQLSQLRDDEKPAQPGAAPATTGNGLG